MILVSAEFETAVRATTRRWRPRLQITWTDPQIDPTITASANDENRINYPEQTADLITNPTHKWAHIDGIMVPDGTYYPAPGTITEGQMGWWGAIQCNGNAEWSVPYPMLTVEFAERPIVSLAVVGDSIYNEYPVDFDIEIYDIDDVLLHTEVVTGNALLSWAADISGEGINDATYMKLIIKKWNVANRIVKILEFYTSVSDAYEGDDIVSMNLLEEREIADGSLPIGNISANELDFELQNIRLVRGSIETIDPFSYENSASYLENVLKKNRRVIASIGLVLPDSSVEYVTLGTFWTGDWNNSELSPVVSTSARDRMEFLRKAEFTKSIIYEGVTLYVLMETVLNSAKTDIPMTDLIWDIDAELQDFVIPYAYFPRQSYFKCIKQIVEACRGQAYVNRNDTLIVTGPSFAGI
jgi:hypothetical protein